MYNLLGLSFINNYPTFRERVEKRGGGINERGVKVGGGKKGG